MPELPEVETIARGVHERVRGDRIAHVWFGGHREPFKTPAARQATGLEDVCCWRYIEPESTSSANWDRQSIPPADLLPPARLGEAHSPQTRPTHNGLSISA